MNDLDALLPAIARRDEDAFASWMAGAEARIRLSLATFARVVDTEAVVQETLVRVWTLAPSFEPDGAPNALVRFAVRLARNLAVSESRKTRPLPMTEEHSEIAVEAELPDPLLRSAILECIQRLPERPREVFDARLASRGAEPDEVIAARMSMRTNTFLQNFVRARRFLAECLKKRGVPQEGALSS